MTMTNTVNRKEAAKRAANDLVDFANWASVDEFEDFANELTSAHRTLQQSVFRLMSECIRAWSDCRDEEWYDMRNEATVEAASELWNKTLKHRGFPRI